MPDQSGGKCATHDPHTCFCDERRDREAGIHRPGGLDDGMGGYLCVCGDAQCSGGRFPFAGPPAHPGGTMPPLQLDLDECVYPMNQVKTLCTRIDAAHLRAVHPNAPFDADTVRGVKAKKTTVKQAPFDADGNLMHYVGKGDYGWPQPHEWRDNVPFEAYLTIDSMKSGRSAKYLILADDRNRQYPMFVTDLIAALNGSGVARGQFVARQWMVARRGRNYGVRVARDDDYPAGQPRLTRSAQK